MRDRVPGRRSVAPGLARHRATAAGAGVSCASPAPPARRCCRCGSVRAIPRCSTARRRCTSPRAPPCCRARSSPRTGVRIGLAHRPADAGAARRRRCTAPWNRSGRPCTRSARAREATPRGAAAPGARGRSRARCWRNCARLTAPGHHARRQAHPLPGALAADSPLLREIGRLRELTLPRGRRGHRQTPRRRRLRHLVRAHRALGPRGAGDRRRVSRRARRRRCWPSTASRACTPRRCSDYPADALPRLARGHGARAAASWRRRTGARAASTTCGWASVPTCARIRRCATCSARCRSVPTCRSPRASSWSSYYAHYFGAQGQRGRRESSVPLPGRAAELRRPRCRRQFPRAQGQPRRPRRAGADAVQAVHRAVRTRRRALPRLRRGSRISTMRWTA